MAAVRQTRLLHSAHCMPATTPLACCGHALSLETICRRCARGTGRESRGSWLGSGCLVGRIMAWTWEAGWEGSESLDMRKLSIAGTLADRTSGKPYICRRMAHGATLHAILTCYLGFCILETCLIHVHAHGDVPRTWYVVTLWPVRPCASACGTGSRHKNHKMVCVVVCVL